MLVAFLRPELCSPLLAHFVVHVLAKDVLRNLIVLFTSLTQIAWWHFCVQLSHNVNLQKLLGWMIMPGWITLSRLGPLIVRDMLHCIDVVNFDCFLLFFDGILQIFVAR